MDLIEATYENGVFVPSGPVHDLPAGTKVWVETKREPDTPSGRLLAALRRDGFTPFRVGDGHDPVIDRGEIWDRESP